MAEQSREGKEGRRRRVLLFIEGKDASGFDSSRTRSPRRQQRVTARESGEDGRRQAATWRRRQAGGGVGLQIDFFELFTELPLRLFYKLLTNFLKKLKISKNKSCSTFQTLQLCFNEHFQILPLLKFEFGMHLSI